ncbi:hypothetical protein [Mesorhizobium sp.]|uniref:hypothetical protein n=1 Tax=Mesorhizobium sp. TaxID=1871066 RepID=UPI0025D883A1|nr:hypothetical protein [Mesorhizobium sp.]
MNATDEQIKYMVHRFLCWELPQGFNPDHGISYKNPVPHLPNIRPMGTNLFDATQAEEMVRNMVAGMAKSPDETGWLIERGGSASPMYWQGPGKWSGDHITAIRFARRQDAETVRSAISFDRAEDLPPHTVAEHAWDKP